jgi:pimeloyl-ACP methyl ester carboxylesterase
VTWIARALWISLGAYSVLVLLVFVLQRRLIYLPTRLTPPVADAAARTRGALPWRDPAGQIIGWQWPAPAPSAGAVLVVHGNAGSALDRAYLADPIRRAGAMDVFVLEYPGYGPRAGAPTERSILAAADEAFEALSARRPVFVVGESLGAGAATHLTRRFGARVSGVLLFAPFNNLQSVAQQIIPFVPIKLLLRDRFDPSSWLAGYPGPVAIVLAESDEVIPARFGRQLYDGYTGIKQLQVIPDAGHNDIPSQPIEWWRRVFEFWRKPES